MHPTTRGYLDLTVGQISIAVNVVLAKYLTTSIMLPFVFLGFRFLFATFLLLGMVALNRGRLLGEEHPTGRFGVKDWALLWGQALTAGFLFNYFFLYGLQKTTATSAGIIASVLPAMIAIFSFWLLKERLSLRKWGAIVLAMVGILILSGRGVVEPGSGSASLLGDLCIFIALIPEALYSILVKLLGRRVDVIAAAFFTNLFTLILLLPLMLMGLAEMGPVHFEAQTWGLLLLGGIGSTGFYWLWSRGLQVIPTNTAGIFGSVLPVATALIAVIFLDEVMTSYDGIGMILVMGSIILGTTGDRKYPNHSPHFS